MEQLHNGSVPFICSILLRHKTAVFRTYVETYPFTLAHIVRINVTSISNSAPSRRFGVVIGFYPLGAVVTHYRYQFCIPMSTVQQKHNVLASASAPHLHPAKKLNTFAHCMKQNHSLD